MATAVIPATWIFAVARQGLPVRMKSSKSIIFFPAARHPRMQSGRFLKALLTGRSQCCPYHLLKYD